MPPPGRPALEDTTSTSPCGSWTSRNELGKTDIQALRPLFRKDYLMPSPFPGMDPFLETNPIFQELHTQMLAEMQAMLQPQLRPKYVARLERHLSEGSVWEAPAGISLERKE